MAPCLWHLLTRYTQITHYPAFYLLSLFAVDWAIGFYLILLPRLMRPFQVAKPVSLLRSIIVLGLSLHFFLIPIMALFRAWNLRLVSDLNMLIILGVAHYQILRYVADRRAQEARR
jgi:hypothetical protein